MSRARFMPVVFGRDGKAQPNKNLRNTGTQDFYMLRKRCLTSYTLFEDPDFPANDSSLANVTLSAPDDELRPEVTWLRPCQISDDPKFFVKRYSRFDVNQGELGDCWLLAAAINLTQDPQLFTRVVPEDNSFAEGDYAGIFHFRFWRYGQWYDVVVDDQLPTVEGQLIYMRSSENNEFWSALLEKAYAKLFGSYEALIDGSASEAMVDFTGGIAETFELNGSSMDLFHTIEKGFKNRAMFTCNLELHPNVPRVTPEGLIRGHAYSLTMVKIVEIETPSIQGRIALLRLRNSWGNTNEWRGPWSDESREWMFIPEKTKHEIGLTFEQDGEFWMSYRDFVTYFDYIEMCTLSPNCPIDRQSDESPWWQSAFEGEWVAGNTAGGCRNHEDTFWHNPQYVVRLDGPDKDDAEGQTTIAITLMQKNRRSMWNNGRLNIGFVIYQVTNERALNQKPLPREFFQTNNFVGGSTFSAVREVTCRFRLDPGTYVVIPSTYEPNIEGEFMIRLFSEYPDCMTEHEGSVGECDLDPRIMMDMLDPINPNPRRAEIERHFAYVAGEDREVDSTELKMVLDNYYREYIAETGFSKDVCRSMVAMLDEDHSGKLGLKEFQTLLMEIDRWTEVFKLYDPERTGHLNPFDLRAALRSAGYSLSNKIINSMLHRYGSNEGLIYFDDFISCAVKVKTMIDIFCSKDLNGSNVASFSMNEWIYTTIYC